MLKWTTELPTEPGWYAWRIGKGHSPSFIYLVWGVPRNTSDFRSCMFLLEYIPEWRERLPEVAERFPAWEPFVKRWDEFERLYKKNEDVELYRRIMVIRGIA